MPDEFKSVLNDVIKAVNLIKAKALNSRLYADFTFFGSGKWAHFTFSGSRLRDAISAGFIGAVEIATGLVTSYYATGRFGSLRMSQIVKKNSNYSGIQQMNRFKSIRNQNKKSISF